MTDRPASTYEAESADDLYQQIADLESELDEAKQKLVALADAAERDSADRAFNFEHNLRIEACLERDAARAALDEMARDDQSELKAARERLASAVALIDEMLPAWDASAEGAPAIAMWRARRDALAAP